MTDAQIETMKDAARRSAIAALVPGVFTAGPIVRHGTREFIIDPMKSDPLATVITWTLLLGGLAGAVWFFAPVVQRKVTNYRRGPQLPGGFL